MKCVKRRLTKRIDKTYNDKFYKTNKKLMDILSEGEQWGHKPANQEYAKEKVKEFYRELKSTKERKEYIDRGSRLSYVHLTCKCQIRIYEIRFYLGMSRIAGYITL